MTPRVAHVWASSRSFGLPVLRLGGLTALVPAGQLIAAERTAAVQSPTPAESVTA